MDSCYRALTVDERALLERLLSVEFPGRDELRRQLNVVTARSTDVQGILSLNVDPNLAANVKCRIPAEGECADTDGVMIHVLLHVVDGRMAELEIYKNDGSAVRRPPSPEALSIFTPFGAAGVLDPRL
jgi:hypothetical protein